MTEFERVCRRFLVGTIAIVLLAALIAGGLFAAQKAKSNLFGISDTFSGIEKAANMNRI